MIRNLAFAAAAAVATFVSVSSSAFATANCPSASTPICRQTSCTGPITKPVCSCIRWECAIVKDPTKGDKVMQARPMSRPTAVR
jgi:hypothetical protein